MHDGGHHWFIMLVKIKDKQAEIWDLLPDARRTRDREIQVNSIVSPTNFFIKTMSLVF